MRAARVLPQLLPRLLFVAAAYATTGCAMRAQPYRFASPMLGGADVPPVWLGRSSDGRSPDEPARTADERRPQDPYAARPAGRGSVGRLPDATASTPDSSIRVASASAAAAVPTDARARGVVWSRLAAPHRATPIVAAIASGADIPTLREPSDLRALVGRRDHRGALEVTLAWSRALGGKTDAKLDVVTSGAGVVGWATSIDRRAAPTDPIAPGDLLVFDHTDSDDADDLVAIAIGRDARGVIEMIYLAGGVVRRGLVDPVHPARHRDDTGAVINTFMRVGKRWPPKGTHYLAGELLVHVIHVHRASSGSPASLATDSSRE